MASTSPRREDDETNVVRLPRKEPAGRIYRVPVTVAQGIKPLTKVVPTLVWEDGMDEWVADYARHLIFRPHNAASSVEETVKKLRIFRRFQREHNVPYEHVDDNFLIAFQGAIEHKGRATHKRRDQVLSAVHDLFKWADGLGRLVNHVQTRPKIEYDLPDDYQFPISSEVVTVRGPHGQSYEKWVTTLTGGATHSTYGMRKTPTSEQVFDLAELVEADERNGVRNKLIMDWALFTGARVGEIVQLRESDLPDFNDVQSFFDDDGFKVVEVSVERKNRGRAMLHVPGDLALRTAEYIAQDEQRRSIIARHPGGFRNEKAIFLSEKGGALNTDSISRIFRGYFQAAGITKANIHRLRAKYLTEMIEFQLDRYSAGGVEVDMTSSWQDSILIAACQAMGHSHPKSLLPYLTEILQRRTTRNGKLEARSVEMRERSLQDMMKQLDARLRHHPRLVQITKLVEQKQIQAALSVLADVQDQLREML